MDLRLESEHRPEAIRRRLARRPGHSLLRDAVYGAVDGAVTTFAVVSGVAGADLGTGVVIVLGAANLVADGFSMAASNFLGTRAEREEAERTRAAEQRQVAEYPEGEVEEIRQIFAAKGFEGDELERVVAVVTSDVDRWVETMLVEEHGLALAKRDPWRSAVATFVAFLCAGAMPLLPFVAEGVVDVARPFTWSVGLTAATFLGIGALKSRFLARAPWRGALETLAVGALAASLAWVTGALLQALGAVGP